MESVDTENVDTGSVDAAIADTESVATESGNTESAIAQSVRVEALSQMSRLVASIREVASKIFHRTLLPREDYTRKVFLAHATRNC